MNDAIRLGVHRDLPLLSGHIPTKRVPITPERHLADGAAQSSRHIVAAALPSEVGGHHGKQRARTTEGAGSGRAVASATRSGRGPALRRQPPVLPGGGQGPGQVRDAACARGGRLARQRGGPHGTATRARPTTWWTGRSPNPAWGGCWTSAEAVGVHSSSARRSWPSSDPHRPGSLAPTWWRS